MNRRGFLKALIAVPAVVVAASRATIAGTGIVIRKGERLIIQSPPIAVYPKPVVGRTIRVRLPQRYRMTAV